MFDQAIADAICEKIADGESLRSICLSPDMPSKTEVFRWLGAAENAAFRDQYARAREAQADALFDEIQDIADDGSNDYTTKERPDGSEYDVFDAEHVQRSKLRIETRKWMAGKLRPKVYGERLAIDAQHTFSEDMAEWLGSR